MQLRYAALTDVGRQRDHNEDCLAVDPPNQVFIVADGMGGHASGEVASTVAVDVIGEALRSQRSAGVAIDDALRSAIEQANGAIHDAASASASLKGMGTTIVVAVLEDGRVHLGHAGDSRAYRLHGGELSRLTKDHSMLQDFVDAMGGQLSEEEQRLFPQRNVITRAVGVRPTLDVAVTRGEVAAGDRLLLCTDGLHGMVDERTLREKLRGVEDLDELVKTLIELANSGGGPDNITAVVVEVVGP